MGGRGKGTTGFADGGNIFIDGGLAYSQFGQTTSNGTIYIGTRDTGASGDFANTTDVIIGKSGTNVNNWLT